MGGISVTANGKGDGVTAGTVKAVIYDCDGVMFDSFEANLAFYQRIMELMSRPPIDRTDPEKMMVLHTYANRKVLEYFFPDEDELQKSVAHASAIDYSELVPLMTMEDGYRETLDQLSKIVDLAVCTNRSTSMETVLACFGLTDYFSCVVTASRVTHPKPHPEPLLKILSHYALAPGQVLFVGDSEVDCLSAQAAGVPFIAYKNDFPSLKRIDHHFEILDLVRQ